MAGAATTLVTTTTQAQSPNDALCAQQATEPDAAEVAGPDTDSIELECGDQNAQDDGKESGETAERGERESGETPAARTGSGQ